MDNKMSKRLKEKLFDQDIKTLMGPCMISFAIPLFIPGITLTLVAFNDETGFSKYSALHIIGMLFLTAAFLLLVTGCIMKFTCKSKVSPTDETLHSKVSTHVRASDDTKGTKSHVTFVKDKVERSPLQLEREPIPGASVGSNETVNVVNETIRQPDVSEARLTSSDGSSNRVSFQEGQVCLSAEVETKTSSRIDEKVKNKRSVPSSSDAPHQQTVQSSQSNSVSSETDSDKNTNNAEDKTQSSDFKSNAIIRQTFSTLREEGDGEEHMGVETKGDVSGSHSKHVVPQILPDDVVGRRTSNAWDSLEQSEEKYVSVKSD